MSEKQTIEQLIEMLPPGAIEMDIFRTDSGEWQIQGPGFYSTGYHKSLNDALLIFIRHELKHKDI